MKKLIFNILLLVLSSITFGQTESTPPDTVRKTLFNLSQIQSFDEIYPYKVDHNQLWYFGFEQFDVAFYECGYAFFTGSYKGEHPKDFFDLLDKNPAQKEIRTGSKLLFKNITIKNDKHIMKGKPFVVLIVDTEPGDEYQEDSWEDNTDYGSEDDYWDDYEDNYDYGDN